MLTLINAYNLLPFNTVVYNQNYQSDYVNHKYGVLNGLYTLYDRNLGIEYWQYTTTHNSTGASLHHMKPVLRPIGSLVNMVYENIIKIIGDNEQKLATFDKIQEIVKAELYSEKKQAYRENRKFVENESCLAIASIMVHLPHQRYINLLREMHFDVDLLIETEDAIDLERLPTDEQNVYNNFITQSKIK